MFFLSKPSKVLTLKWVSLFTLGILVMLTSFKSHAHSPKLELFDSSGAQAGPAIILKSDANMTLTGLINHVVVKQTYQNQNPFAVNARYVFPLPDESAVHAMTMRIGERVIKGQIDKKVAAEKKYAEAKQAGKQAALVRQQRANMFITNVANIAPGEQVIIELEYQEIIDYSSGTFTVRFPGTITPRYHVTQGEIDINKESQKPTNSLPHGWLSPVYSTQKNDDKPSSQFNLNLDIDVGLELVDINSKFHNVNIQNTAFGQYSIELNEQNALNRDFVLEFKPLQKEQAQAAFFTEQFENGERYGLAMLMPPADNFIATQRLARETVFVVDTSGSMHGQSMEQAKNALFYALSLLDSNDSFNIIGFDNVVTLMSDKPLVASGFNLRRAERFIYGLQADGGTEIQGALDAVLDGSQFDGFVRQVIFLTDGSVSNEDALFKSIQAKLGDSRLFTVGIGSAPNSFFMRRAADVGKGSFTFIGSTSEVQPKMQQLFDKLAHPAITNLALSDENGNSLDFWPSPLPDLYFNEPIMVAIKLNNASNVILNGQTAQGPISINLNTQAGSNAKGIAKLWARQKIKSLLLYNSQNAVKDEVQQLALTHQLLSPFTAFIAIEQTQINPIAQQTANATNAVPQGMAMRLPQTDGQSKVHIILGILLLSGFVLVRRFK
ncbi:Ca-activated chloride channel protein [Pseudoalteromonas nigrifaciens]|uniref:Ca-activated chloride channel protein n=1 Tax=Pseudoalteromonas nigrifaciens TaxID=28109 RepID=A0AAC9XWV4_9GAMM|nr:MULTISPECIES: marine proteobacterial sortase target protein [Pseudoalteromonas]ASM53028.1 Ca-activated chloride channel protein [Pseudoalteromonas nigrifaciens]MBH0092414.1 marine proteobacterial sortase target protein [Pseudoalteromonas sp. SCQQ13]GEN41924.1 marine proteobacterial sortase target protein [Pseudoalteromonas nigrifaciens]SUC53104.1 Mg-chelatase subunit ChlD [Pseudoalteromonas nigrifaciens]